MDLVPLTRPDHNPPPYCLRGVAYMDAFEFCPFPKNHKSAIVLPIADGYVWSNFQFSAVRKLGEVQKERNMKDQDLLERITLNPKVMAGKPIIKGTRLTVE